MRKTHFFIITLILLFLAACTSAPAESNNGQVVSSQSQTVSVGILTATAPATTVLTSTVSSGPPPTPAPVPAEVAQQCLLADTSIEFAETDAELEEIEILDTREWCVIELSKPAETAIITLTYTNRSLLCKSGDLYTAGLEGWIRRENSEDYLPFTCAGGLDVLRHGVLGDELVYFIESRNLFQSEHNWLIFDKTKYGLITNAQTVD